ncbi:hypothetical protein M407DRAFT_241932 [Tulasnella calospora MUT 4182]|uniref:Uncharacterized protein n=1 Tax=Tulasnella calospora MUT 4182 TaxID=1051891 RepID=A0A0C3LAU0_9AGAM|nr:hypothetical protein M407DRAFT_241932 [Tulasnella calospora MUT 4182]
MVFALDLLAVLGLRHKRQRNASDGRTFQSAQDFDLMEPSRSLSDDNSVLLRGIHVRNYLEDVFETAKVPRPIWENFVGRVCPSIARNRYVALRLIPAEHYRQLCSLRVAPEPDALIRILLVYTGVPSTKLGDWPKAFGRGEAKDSRAWKKTLCQSVPVRNAEGGFTALELACVQLYLDDE